MLSALLSRLMGNTPPPKEDGLRIVEGVESIWSYHLADGPQRNALCDPKLTMMATGLPLESWGHRAGHLPERYCEACKTLALSRSPDAKRMG
jgi:hypothetical protein